MLMLSSSKAPHVLEVKTSLSLPGVAWKVVDQSLEMDPAWTEGPPHWTAGIPVAELLRWLHFKGTWKIIKALYLLFFVVFEFGFTL